ncbi:MAG: putative quinol monooxygenase [Maricaulaceae bacterium]
MIGVIARLTVKPGMEAEFEKHAKALVEKVNANEPDCALYELFKADGGVYIFMEKYNTKEALAAHGQTEYFLAAQPPLGACLAGAPDIQYYEAVS